MSNNLDMVNVSKISVDVDNPNFIQDEESIVIYESIINQTNKSGKKKKIISKNTNKILKNSNSKPIISKKFTNLINRKMINQIIKKINHLNQIEKILMLEMNIIKK